MFTNAADRKIFGDETHRWNLDFIDLWSLSYEKQRKYI